MDITLSTLGITVALSTCFIGVGVLDTEPTSPVETVTSEVHATFSATQGQAEGDVKVETSLGSFSIFFKDVEEEDRVETVVSIGVISYGFEEVRKPEVEHSVVSYGTSSLIKHKQPKVKNTLETVGVSSVFSKDSILPTLSMSLVSDAHVEAILRSYNLQYVNAYFKHTTNLSSYEVFGIYNNTIVFGSSININATNLHDEVSSQAELACWFMHGVPHTTEEVTTALGNIQTYSKFANVPSVVVTLSTILTARDPSNISPYKVLTFNPFNVTTEAMVIPYAKFAIFNDVHHDVSSQAFVSITPYKLVVGNVSAVTEAALLQYYKNEMLTEHIHTLNTSAVLNAFDVAGVAVEQDINSDASLIGYAKDTTPTYAHSIATTGASDIRSGETLQLSRTELITTVIGNFKMVYNPGILPVMNEAISMSSLFSVAGDNKTAEGTVSLITDYDTNYFVGRVLDISNTVSSTVYTQWVVKDARPTSNINTTSSTSYDLIIYVAPTYLESVVNTTDSQAFVQMYTVLPVEVANTLVTALPNVQTHVKDMLPTVSASVVSNVFIQHYPEHVLKYIENYITSQATMNIMPYKIAQYFVDNTISEFGIYPYVKDSICAVITTAVTNLGGLTVAKGIMLDVSALNNNVATINLISTYTVEPVSVLHTMASTGAADIQAGSNIQISKTESISTVLSSFLYRNNPGLGYGVSNSVSTSGYMQAHAEDNASVDNINVAVTALANADIIHSNYYTITLNTNGGTGGTTSIATVAGFYITPTSITIPTRTHYTFNGYYTATSGGIQRINSSGTYVALDDNTYLTDATLYAQWTDVQYAIVWKSYAGTTLKTENLIYGSTSLAPAGTIDTAQYDYSWPKASTTVTGSETITETRAIKSYLITWKSYSGATLKSQTLNYGLTSTAPTGTTDTTQYDYAWPKSSTTVVGTETITETRTTKSYTITWYAYSGSVAKQETLLYGATSTAPAGTTDTMQYQYDWPKASTTVTGTESINETRTLLSYTVTWYKYGQSGETYAKRETRTYGSTSTAPTGTTDTTQYDYSWPKSSTTVVNTENITETRAIKSYTITWKYYTGANALVETLNYGAVSTAPLGTSDTTAYDYSWPKASTTVVGAETITETRVGQPYTVTFNGNGGGTPSPTSKGVIYNNTYGTLATVSRTNWEFIGWFTAASGGTKRTSSSTMLTTSNHTLYAHWKPAIIGEALLHTLATAGQSDIQYGMDIQISRTETTISALGAMQYENQTTFNITLNANGGTNGTPTSITGLTGQSITPASITPATRTNYTLTGYYTATSGGTKYINADGTYNNLNSNTFIGAVTLYAQWTMNNVYFDYNPLPSTVGLLADIYIGGVLQSDNVSDWHQARPANSVFKVAGLTIPPGWKYSSYTTTRLTGVTVGGSGATTEVQGTGNITQTAARAIAITIVGNTYNVTVVQNSGTGSSASISTYQPKTSATTITMTRGTRTNYRFTHWTVSGANGKATVSGNTITIPTYTTSVQPYGDLTITANWLTAIANNIVNTTTTALGGIQTEVATPFTITLAKQSGSGGTSSITCVNGFYLDPTSITTPTRNGYTFNGYYTATSGGTQRINNAGTYVALTNTTYTSATTLYAQWSLTTYTLTNDRNGGSGGNNSATYNITTSSTLATLLGTVTRTGYTFAGWKWISSSAGGWVNGTTYALNTNVSGKYATGTLQAQWTAKIFVITLNANGGTAATNEAISVQYNTSIEAFNANMVPTRTGYNFNGYYTATSGGTQRISAAAYTALTSTTYSAAATLYAQWTAKTYTVSFNANGGGTPSPLTKSVTYASTYGALASTTRTGYTFAGWFTAASGGTEITSASTVSITAAQTLYAHWDINYYTVTWKDWDGTTLKTQSVAYGGNSTPPLQPRRTGYDFVSWTGTYTNVTSNRTITAKYTVKTYTLSISSITGVASQTVTRTSSPNGGGSIGILVNSALLYYGDVLTISATASNGYNASVSGSPVTVGGNIATNNYITVSYDPSQPIITYTGKTGFSMSFTVKNQNSQYNVRIYYKAGSAPTTSSYDGYVDVGANATSPTQNLDGLIPSTNYNIYARAYKEGSYSPSVYFNQTTNNLTAPSTWYDYSTTSNSITMRVYNPNPVSVTLYYAANQNPPTANSITVPAQSYAYATVSGLSANTTYTIYGRFGYSGKYSSTVSDSAKTNTAVKTWVYITYATSDPAIAPEVYSANATIHTAASILESFYPAANRTVGTFGAVESGGSWFICEVQLV